MTILKRTDAESFIDKIFQEKQQSEQAWVFDCDGTLVNSDIASHTTWGLINMGHIAEDKLPPEIDNFDRSNFSYHDFAELRIQMLERISDIGFYDWETRAMAGLSPRELQNMAREMFQTGNKQDTISLTPLLFPLAQSNSSFSWVVSGSPKPCVLAIAKMADIAPERVIATELELDSEGLLTHRIKDPGLVWQKIKKDLLVQAGVETPYFVAGDTIGDLDMLQISSRYSWCVLWGDHRHRGIEFNDVVNKFILPDNLELPTEAGLYTWQQGKKTWIFEVMANKNGGFRSSSSH